MPLTKTLTGASQYTQAQMVGSGKKLQYEIIESTPNFIATVSIQWIIGSENASQPTPDDSRWATVDEISVSGDDAGVFDGGKAWYRLAILAGDYTSGQATIKLMQG